MTRHGHLIATDVREQTGARSGRHALRVTDQTAKGRTGFERGGWARGKGDDETRSLITPTYSSFGPDSAAVARLGRWHAQQVRSSEFWELVDGEFGRAHGRALVHDHVLFQLANRTAEQALEDGEPSRDVWLALCDALDVPESRRRGQEKKPGARRR